MSLLGSFPHETLQVKFGAIRFWILDSDLSAKKERYVYVLKITFYRIEISDYCKSDTTWFWYPYYSAGFISILRLMIFKRIIFMVMTLLDYNGSNNYIFIIMTYT